MSTVGKPTSTNTFGMVFSTTLLEFKNMAQDPLVRRAGFCFKYLFEDSCISELALYKHLKLTV